MTEQMNDHTNEYALVEVNQEPIELCKLLKIANLVGGGGEAKIVISEGYVLLNGEVEFQKRKKIYEHDVIEFNGEVIQVVVNHDYIAPSPIVKTENKSKTKKAKSSQSKNTQSKKNSSKQTQSKQGQSKNSPQEFILEQELTLSDKPKRRPISF